MGPFAFVAAIHAYHVTALTLMAPPPDAPNVAHVQVVQPLTILLSGGAMHGGVEWPRCRDGYRYLSHGSLVTLPALHATDVVYAAIARQHRLGVPT